MNRKKIYTRYIIAIALGIIVFNKLLAQNADSLTLYTPYTLISVSPGNSVSYSIDLINNSSKVRNENISITNIPKSWNYSLTAGSYNIGELATLPKEKKSMSLKVDVPYTVRKGKYTFYVKAGENVTLPLTINVSSAGSSITELTCDQLNREGTSSSTFTYNAVLKNETVVTQQYALMANAPRGWTVAIKPNSQQATSTEVQANGTKNISYEIKPPSTVAAGTYKIPVRAVSGSTSAGLEFEIVITGTYEMSLNTPSGLLSAHITAGNEKKVELVVKNSGSADLENVTLSAANPTNWQVTFDKKKIEKIAPGQTESIYATITADKKALPGDYVINITAKTPEANSSISFRVSVNTPITAGLIGVFVIILALLGILYLFRKFGRR